MADGSTETGSERRVDDSGELDDAGNPTGDLDLSPREIADAASDGGRRWLPMALLALVVVGLGFLLVRTLGDAALFFYNADQAVERRDDLRDSRFRMQGTPVGEPAGIEIFDGGLSRSALAFVVSFNGTEVDVVHEGAPAELFQPGVPVVLEGTWVRGWPSGSDTAARQVNDGWHFASNDMVVKHDNEYSQDNKDRLTEAEDGGSVEP